MRPALALVAAEEVGVVAGQVTVRRVRRAGRQVAVVAVSYTHLWAAPEKKTSEPGTALLWHCY